MQSDTTMVTSRVPQGTVLGPILFLIYINDKADDITSDIRLLADDCVLCRTINNPSDNTALQEHLSKQEQWSNISQMDLNVKKCAIMQCSTSARKRKKNWLQNERRNSGNCFTASIFRVELSDNLKFNNHINSSTKKALSTRGFLKRNLKYCPPKVKARSYFS